MNDIANEEDIRTLVATFYGRLTNDEVVGHFFTGLDLEKHLPRINAFWEMVLLDKPGYATNVTEVHLKLHDRIPMEKRHFDRWLELWRDTIDRSFAGPKADEAKLRALSVGGVMLIKVQQRG